MDSVAVGVDPAVVSAGITFGRMLQSQPSAQVVHAFAQQAKGVTLALDEASFRTEATRKVFLEAGRELRDWARDADFNLVEKDYIRLFVGLERTFAAPWESVYMSEGCLVFQPGMLEVRHWYRSRGFKARTSGKGPDDHVGLELEFVCTLLERGSKEDVQCAVEFSREHLMRWVGAWRDDVLEYAEVGFYRALAKYAFGISEEISKLEVPE